MAEGKRLICASTEVAEGGAGFRFVVQRFGLALEVDGAHRLTSLHTSAVAFAEVQVDLVADHRVDLEADEDEWVQVIQTSSEVHKVNLLISQSL